MSSKRFLTEYEIENILSFITPQIGIPTETANIVVTTNKNALRKQLITQQIYPEMIPDLANIIEQQYMSSNIQPGESVGVIGAQSIGEKQTKRFSFNITINNCFINYKTGTICATARSKLCYFRLRSIFNIRTIVTGTHN